jgi:cob(I)alamin adenosyltransferase
MIQVYTGNGKGKTTAALGLALRASGAGLRVYLAQFLKGRPTSEMKAMRRLKNITVMRCGASCFVRGVPGPADCRQARSGFTRAAAAAESGRYDVIILDEINCVLNLGMVSVEEMLALIRSVPASAELVLTGRDAPRAVLDAADLVTEMREQKHYFSRGKPCRRGIEH